MCEFCNDSNKGNLMTLATGHKQVGEIAFDLDVWISRGESVPDSLHMVTSFSIGDCEGICLNKEINYCPMCGKRFGGEKSSMEEIKVFLSGFTKEEILEALTESDGFGQIASEICVALYRKKRSYLMGVLRRNAGSAGKKEDFSEFMERDRRYRKALEGLDDLEKRFPKHGRKDGLGD